ncbi:hypothetical protein [Polaribacter sp. Z022]|uniref:hypothetical protein n=1 Tax=Polaribacter sp. Z022 TaxID=2927125 RepID=UPI002020603C|nr:hypothetical protein [Polaribacter sp. Z022]MCL7754940.1 hypothetical protein [Polaribacter sp. Z022]
MKGKLLILSCFLLLITFDSCFDDEMEYEDDYESPNCVSLYKVSKDNKFIIWNAKEIDFEIINECESSYYIYDYYVSGDIKNIKIEGFDTNKIINSDNLPFKVIVSPISVGNKAINIFINTSIGTMFITMYVDVVYQ